MRGRRNRLVTMAVAATLALCVPQPSVAATFGLVVGIDDYQHLPSLAGAVNDARDIADALRGIGASEIITLLDRAATREAILAAWKRLVERADPGDTIVFSYAGHGGQEPERVPGSERDGLDEVFQLAGFDTTAPANGQRIIDDELNFLFAESRHLKIVFIADSCHSGTMTRNFDARAGVLRTRLGGYGAITNDTLPPPRPEASAIDPEALENLVYFGAVQDNQVAQEFFIEGQARGALSWSFARALRGHADINRDGVVNTGELSQYLLEKVRTRTQGRQFPQMTPRGTPAEITIVVGIPAVPGMAVGTPETGETDGHLALHILNADNAEELLGKLSDVVAAERHQADLIWDHATGDIVSGDGDVVARLGVGQSAQSVQPVIDKWLLLRDLERMAETRPLGLRIEPDHGLHRKGEEITVILRGHQHRRLTAFNLAVDGTVQFLIPEPDDPDPLYHGKLKRDITHEFRLSIMPPYGADHLVTVVAPTHNAALITELKTLGGHKAAGLLRRRLPDLLKEQVFQLGYISLFTAP